METLILALVALQTLGAFTGSVAVVWGELAYVRAMRDGKIDKAERAHLDAIAAALRFGMVLILLSSLGLIIAAYLVAAEQPAATASYWILMILSLLIVWASWALSRKRITFSYGSALVFSGWWFLAYLTLGWLQPLSFTALILTFVVVTALFYAVLSSTRYFALRKG